MHLPTRYRFGLNYTPSQEWWYCWNHFQPESIARDLDAIAKIGADHIRIMLIWPSFQPNAGWVSPAHLDHLDTVMNLAAARGLDVCPTLLNGWLTGLKFLTPFDDGKFYRSSAMRDAQRLYFEKVGERLRSHTNLLAVDLGNEMNCCWQDADLAQGDAWARWAVSSLQGLLPDTLIVHGADHNPWFEPHTFSPHCLATLSPAITLHCWAEFTGALKRGGPFDAPALQLAPGMAALARAYAGDPEKPVWLQEYGASEMWMPAEVIPEFLEKTTQSAIRHGIGWITWWASHDIRREFKVDPLEYSLGLLDVGNQPKPSAAVFQALATAYRGRQIARSPVVPEELPAVHSPEETWKWMQKSFG